MPRYIDADKLEELCDIMLDKCDGIGESIWEQFRTTVEWSPTADVQEVKHGEWKERETFYADKYPIEEWQSARCSVCGKYHTTPYLYFFNDYNFCPNCGANMKGDK